MSVSTIGDPIMHWDSMPKTVECVFPWGHYCNLLCMASPYGKRKFLVTMVDCDGDKLIGDWVAVEIGGNCPYVAQLERGGGITWSEFFLRFDRLLLFTVDIFGRSRLQPRRFQTIRAKDKAFSGRLWKSVGMGDVFAARLRNARVRT